MSATVQGMLPTSRMAPSSRAAEARARVQLWVAHLPAEPGLASLLDGAAAAWLAHGWIHPAEMARARRIRLPLVRAQTLVARAMLRQAMVRLCAGSPQRYRIALDERGKPMWQDCSGLTWPHFNISHSGQLVVCALSTHPVGVDVEQMQRPLACHEGLAAHCLHRTELPWQARAGGERARRRLLALWTVKEACLKVNGEGLSQAMDQLQIRAEARMRGHCLLEGASAWHWQARRPAPGYLAVCSALQPLLVEPLVHCAPLRGQPTPAFR